jgi:hypothetical protein
LQLLYRQLQQFLTALRDFLEMVHDEMVCVQFKLGAEVVPASASIWRRGLSFFITLFTSNAQKHEFGAPTDDHSAQ